MIVRRSVDQVVLRDGPGLRVFFGGVLLGLGVPTLVGALRGGAGWAWTTFGLAAIALGVLVLLRSPRIVTVFDARISTVVVARRSLLGTRSTVRLPLDDVATVSVAGGRLLLERVSDDAVVSLSSVARPSAVASAHAAVSAFLLASARPR